MFLEGLCAATGGAADDFLSKENRVPEGDMPRSKLFPHSILRINTRFLATFGDDPL